MKTVIITGNAHPVLETELQTQGLEVYYRPEISRSELLELLPDAIGLVVTTRIKVDKQIIDAAPHLQWIGRLGSGMELIDTSYAASKGIACYSSPEGNRNAVAEQALAMLLSILNNLPQATQNVKGGIWLREENRGTELNGRKVGIFGFGNTGSAFARLLQPFGGQVLAYDKYRSGFAQNHVQESTMEEILDTCEVISFHLPLTEETKHLANSDFFTRCKQAPIFMNTARGQLVDTAALIEALKLKRIRGAALDVLENENLASYTAMENSQLQWLLAQPNVIITPHIAGYSHEAHYKMSTVLLEKLGFDLH